MQNFIVEIFADEGIEFSEIFIDRSFAHENKPTRKPNTGLLTKYLSGEYDLANSFVIGDRETDVQLAKNLGAKAIFIKNPNFDSPNDRTMLSSPKTGDEIYEFLKLAAAPRRAPAQNERNRNFDRTKS